MAMTVLLLMLDLLQNLVSTKPWDSRYRMKYIEEDLKKSRTTPFLRKPITPPVSTTKAYANVK